MLVLGMREMQGFLEQWQLDAGDLRRRMYWAPTPRERERMACPMAFGPRLDCGGGGRGAGTGCPYHWPVGCRLRRGRSGGDGLRAVGWFPPAIDGVQQTELKAVVQEFQQRLASTWPIGTGRWCADLCRNVSRSP